MGIATRQRPVNTALTALLIVGAVLVLFDLARVVLLDLTGSNRPRTVAALSCGTDQPTTPTDPWSAVAASRWPRSRAAHPTRPGSRAAGVLLREREDGPWLEFSAAITETSMVWYGVSGIRYGTDSPTGDIDDSPNATLQADGTLTLSDH